MYAVNVEAADDDFCDNNKMDFNIFKWKFSFFSNPYLHRIICSHVALCDASTGFYVLHLLHQEKISTKNKYLCICFNENDCLTC